MGAQKFPGLNGDKVFDQYPKSTKAIKEWIGSFPQAAEVLGDEAFIFDNSIKALFYYDVRKLYEFFDSQGLVLLIGKIEDHWSFHIEADLHSYSSDSRIEAEEKGFQMCFELLEKKL